MGWAFKSMFVLGKLEMLWIRRFQYLPGSTHENHTQDRPNRKLRPTFQTGASGKVTAWAYYLGDYVLDFVLKSMAQSLSNTEGRKIKNLM